MTFTDTTKSLKNSLIVQISKGYFILANFTAILFLIAGLLVPLKMLQAKNITFINLVFAKIDETMQEVSQKIDTLNSGNDYPNRLPIANEIIRPIKVMYITTTAYSSTVDQCDSTPCITANGFNVCEHNQENIIAANFLPFEAKVRFPELYGDTVFIVKDRMNERYTYRVDFWKKTREAAKLFGLKNQVKMEILAWN